MSEILKEANRLHGLGCAILWLRPKSKAPIKNGWTTGPRETWKQLQASFVEGQNVGVRLGGPSHLGAGYLAVFDVDVKSPDGAHRDEAEAAIREILGAVYGKTAEVVSGRGNGSRHVYVLTREPVKPRKLRTSLEKVKVLMPSAPIPKILPDGLTPGDVKLGLRLRPAWEISLMGEGQQVVLPPSTHPDSGRNYAWLSPLRTVSDLMLIDPPGKSDDEKIIRQEMKDWVPVPVDIINSELPDSIVDLIMYADTEDGSAAIFSVAICMIRARFTDDEIMSVLTDKTNELGLVAYRHAGETNSRKRAAKWIKDHTLTKARRELSYEKEFSTEVTSVILSDEEAKAQAAELLTEIDWEQRLERNGPKGNNPFRPKATLQNVCMILEKAVGPNVFRRDMFAYRDFYGCPIPWLGEQNAALTDDDCIHIKLWIGKNYRFEPSKDLVAEAMTAIATKNGFDPVKKWLDDLPTWDGENRLDGWLIKNFEAEGQPEYLAQVFRKWVVAMVTRVKYPGAKFDWMPIFEGAQGVGKSSFGRMLVGEKYFLDWLPNLGDKDAALGLQGIWGVEMGELASMRKNEIEVVKAFLTRTIDKVRAPYGRKWLEVPRRCVFFGTTNHDTYLRDATGNRRFKPVKVGSLNFEILTKEREQLFAEAIFIVDHKFEATLELEGIAKEFEAQIHLDKMVQDESDVMKDEILAFIENPPQVEPAFPFTKFRLMQVFQTGFGPLQAWRLDSRTMPLAVKALRALGFENFKSGGRPHWRLKNGVGKAK